nr:helix-turn-helix transcriptional regulator [uncultured Sphingomonas sp.]
MKLGTYLAERQITYHDFAQRIGAANAGVISKYVTGKRHPRPKFLVAIVRETDGEVRPNDFIPAAGE